MNSTYIQILENQSNAELENDIYYRRELLTNSLEGRRVDLLTITSFHSIQNEQEYRFFDLFPETNTQRCNLFKNKKVPKYRCYKNVHHIDKLNNG